MKEPSSSSHTHTGLISPVPWPTFKLLLKNAQCALRSIAICRLKASAVHYINTSTGKRLCPCALSASVPLTLWDRTKWFAPKKLLFSETLGLWPQKGKRTCSWTECMCACAVLLFKYSWSKHSYGSETDSEVIHERCFSDFTISFITAGRQQAKKLQ